MTEPVGARKTQRPVAVSQMASDQESKIGISSTGRRRRRWIEPCIVAGSCQAQPTNEGLACDDGEACTTGDVCTAGVCAGSAIVDCAGSRIVVANSGDGSASFIRTSDLVVEATSATGVAPEGVAITPD